MREHTTHYDDCGCKSARYDAYISDLHDKLKHACIARDENEYILNNLKEKCTALEEALEQCSRATTIKYYGDDDQIEVSSDEAIIAQETLAKIRGEGCVGK